MAKKITRIIYTGDSTVTYNKISTYPQTGLSQGLLWYLKDDVFLRSFAINGRSTKSFIEEGRLAEAEEYLEEGDHLFIQFGHNDEKASDPARYTEAFGEYQENLRSFIGAARRHKAHPLLITPIARRLFDEKGRFQAGSHGDYPAAMKELAAKEGVPCIDMTALTEEYLKNVGDHTSRSMYVYPKDNSHLVMQGAMIYGGFLADGLLALGSPHAELLVRRDVHTIDDHEKEAVDPYMVFAYADGNGGDMETVFQQEPDGDG